MISTQEERQAARNYTPQTIAELNRRYSKWRKHHRSWMFRAHKLVMRAVKFGVLPRAQVLDCADCGSYAAVYDHRDYRDALNVAPVCVSCNFKRGEGWSPKYKVGDYLAGFEQYPFLFGIPHRRTMKDQRLDAKPA